jgi:phosphate transport system protein
MKPFEYELESLSDLIFEMFELVKDQMHLTKEALLTGDQDLSSEIMMKEKRVNAYEISVDRECEDFIALQTPVASDLRFTIAALKISGSLERIGDHAYRISSFVFDDLMKLNKELVELLQIPTMFDDIDDMLINACDALESGDIKLAKKVFKQDKTLDKINRDIPKLLGEYYKKDNYNIQNIILLSRTIGKLERVGDLAKNIAEEVIFYYESKVIKHKKKNKRIEKKLEGITDKK